jgi:hypothetical protein
VCATVSPDQTDRAQCTGDTFVQLLERRASGVMASSERMKAARELLLAVQ